MEKNAEELMFENISKNLSDADEYPAMMQMHARCVSIISHLWNVQKGERAIGSATTGSSEAIHLGGVCLFSPSSFSPPIPFPRSISIS